MSFAPETDNLAKPQTLMRVPVGLASPLWGLFAGVAVSSATWWWMTRWARPENLEAMFGAAAKTEAVVEAEVEALAAPAVEVAEVVVEEAEAVVKAAPELAAEPIAEATLEPMIEAEAMAEPIVEAVAEAAEEATPVPALEALAESTPDFAPVGGEAAPISPVLEALAPEPFEAGVEEAPAEVFAEAVAEAAAPAPKVKKKAAAPKAD
ncbi:hypothetical protein [Phenylobacterium sp.]|jgi:hypothetical protein|uniref:hypothetical protein n=1 Tax=Phenylobacterium sp. TaxID=1871053 RepID=UPI002E378622|nr:hypothetical protein [Phenylobacterium sp.]HEX3363949.1 hypothetical protein [Phenylobacterium sp.]